MTLVDQMAEDAEMMVPSEEKLNKLAEYVKEQIQLENDILELTNQLAEKANQQRKVSEEYIPNLFAELGISEFKLEDGSAVVVKPYYSASISEENKKDAFEWLRTHNLEDIIKHEIKVIFGKGEDEECLKLQNELLRLNVNYTDKEAVHPQTLKALVRERLENVDKYPEASQQLPLVTFGVYTGRKTKIVVPKKRK